MLIPQLLEPEIDKCIYLDSDLIVNMDIAELWHVDIADKPLAAVDEIDIEGNKYVSRKYLVTSGLVRAEDYFNSGVLLMNLNFLRGDEKNLFNGVKWRGQHTKTNCFDQDILNYLYAKTYIKLPVKFDTFVRQERILSQTTIRRKIYHYPNESLNLDMNDPFNRLWMSYFIKSPWFNADTIGSLFAVIQQLHVGLKTSMIQLSTLISGKARAFVVLPNKVEATRQIFSMHPDEEIILFKSPDSLPKIFDAMKRGRGQKIFFVMLPNFPFKIFTDAGFVYGKDFLNGMEFLSEANGVPLDSYPFVKAM